MIGQYHLTSFFSLIFFFFSLFAYTAFLPSPFPSSTFFSLHSLSFLHPSHHSTAVAKSCTLKAQYPSKESAGRDCGELSNWSCSKRIASSYCCDLIYNGERWREMERERDFVIYFLTFSFFPFLRSIIPCLCSKIWPFRAGDREECQQRMSVRWGSVMHVCLYIYICMYACMYVSFLAM